MSKILDWTKDALAIALMAFGFAIVVILLIVVLSYGITGLLNLSEYGECHSLSSYNSRHEYRWSIWTGCLVESSSGYWVDSDTELDLLELTVGSE